MLNQFNITSKIKFLYFKDKVSAVLRKGYPKRSKPLTKYWSVKKDPPKEVNL